MDKIICLSFANGKEYDFRLFKESHAHVLLDTLLEADTGYLGLTDLHSNFLKLKFFCTLNRAEMKFSAKIIRNFTNNYGALIPYFGLKQHAFASKTSKMHIWEIPESKCFRPSTVPYEDNFL